MKIKDRITLGVISGVIAGLPDTIINLLEHKAGITDLTYGHMGANVFLPHDKSHRPESLVAGYAANAALTGLTGILFSYLLSASGRDHAVLKGIGAGITFWMLVYGLGGKLGLTAKPKKTVAPILSLLDHILFGSLLGLITEKLADESLFSPKLHYTGEVEGYTREEEIKPNPMPAIQNTKKKEKLVNTAYHR